jgi:hypothetical protein
MAQGMCSIQFWDLSKNRLSDVIAFARALGTYWVPIQGIVLNDVDLNDAALRELFENLTANPKLHQIEELSVTGSAINRSNCELVSAWLQTIADGRLMILGIGSGR